MRIEKNYPLLNPNVIKFDNIPFNLGLINQRHIPFDQRAQVIDKLNLASHKTLLDVNYKYGGLCELICNRLLIDDFLGKAKDLIVLDKQLSVERLNEEKIKKSHLLKIFSIFRKAIAYLFGIYPDNIFSFVDQWKLVNKFGVNQDILKAGLTKIEDGETLKFEVLKKEFLSFTGHSLLIKKIANDNYIFFDPNTGEHRDLSFLELSSKINEQINMWHASDIFITKGRDYLKRLN